MKSLTHLAPIFDVVFKAKLCRTQASPAHNRQRKDRRTVLSIRRFLKANRLPAYLTKPLPRRQYPPPKPTAYKLPAAKCRRPAALPPGKAAHLPYKNFSFTNSVSICLSRKGAIGLIAFIPSFSTACFAS